MNFFNRMGWAQRLVLIVSITAGLTATAIPTLYERGGQLSISADVRLGNSANTAIGRLLPFNAGGTQSIGAAAQVWGDLFATGWRDSSNNIRMTITNASTNGYRGAVANSSTNTAHSFTNTITLSGTTRIAEFHNDAAGASPEVFINNDGSIVGGTDATVNLGSTASRVNKIYPVSINDTADILRYSVTASAANVYQGNSPNSGANAAHVFKNNTSLSGVTRIVEFHNDTTAAAAESFVISTGAFQSADPTAGAQVEGTANDGANRVGTTIGVIPSNAANWTTDSTRLVRVLNNATVKWFIDEDGSHQGSFTTLKTCAAGFEGMLALDVLSGVATGKRTKLCLCSSDGASAYVWQNVATATLGTATTCGTE